MLSAQSARSVPLSLSCSRLRRWLEQDPVGKNYKTFFKFSPEGKLEVWRFVYWMPHEDNTTTLYTWLQEGKDLIAERKPYFTGEVHTALAVIWESDPRILRFTLTNLAIALSCILAVSDLSCRKKVCVVDTSEFSFFRKEACVDAAPLNLIELAFADVFAVRRTVRPVPLKASGFCSVSFVSSSYGRLLVCSACFQVSLLLIPNLVSAAIVVVVVFLVDLWLFGFMALINLRLSMISMVNLLISIGGFCFDWGVPDTGEMQLEKGLVAWQQVLGLTLYSHPSQLSSVKGVAACSFQA